MAEVQFTKTARDDLKGIHDYIARDSVFYADVFTERLIKATERLERFPYSGRVVPEIGDPHVREVIYKAYRIMYKIDADKVFITQITHGAKDFAP